MLEKGWITVRAAAKLAKKSIPTIYQRIAAEDIEISRVGGRLFVNRASLESYYNSKRWIPEQIIDEFKETGQAFLGYPDEFLSARGGYYRDLVKEVEAVGAKLDIRSCDVSKGSHKEVWIVKQ